jgi:hypothetical protein
MFLRHHEPRTLPDGRPLAFRPAGLFSGGESRSLRVPRVDKKLILGALLLSTPVVAAFGLAVTFPDLVMEQVTPGSVFRSVKDKGIPYVITNKTDGPVDIEVLLEARPAKDVKPGYEPVPHPEWLKVVPNRVHLERGEKASAELILSIPKDKSLVGRHFEAAIHARTVGETFLAAGVLHTVCFSVGVPAPVVPAPRGKEK